MPKVKFIKDYNHRMRSGSVIAYEAGWSGRIPTAHAKAAQKAGKCKAIKEQNDESRTPKTFNEI